MCNNLKKRKGVGEALLSISHPPLDCSGDLRHPEVGLTVLACTETASTPSPKAGSCLFSSPGQFRLTDPLPPSHSAKLVISFVLPYTVMLILITGPDNFSNKYYSKQIGTH